MIKHTREWVVMTKMMSNEFIISVTSGIKNDDKGIQKKIIWGEYNAINLSFLSLFLSSFFFFFKQK